MRLARWLPALLMLAASSAFAVDLPPAGSRGHGLTVFEGETVERFEVEILGALRDSGGTGDMILARLSGGPLERTGVMQGMSGSPVWVDGELVGAVMSTWSFTTEALAALRPIDEMLPLAAYLEEGGHPGWSPGEGSVRAPLSAPPPGAPLPDPLALLRGEREDPAPLGLGSDSGLAWVGTGWPASVRERLESVLGQPVQVVSDGADMGASSGATTLEAGDAVAALLVDGDARLAAVGTVTRRVGDTVLAFGHPLLGSGAVSLPMTRARVVALVPSREISFKLAMPTERVGALLVDRRAGVSGRLGVRADMLPLELQLLAPGVEGEREARFHFELARVQGLMPQLAGWAVQSALLDRDEISAQSSLDLRVEIEIEGEPPLISSATLGGGPLAEQLSSELGLPLALLALNPDRALRLEKVRVEARLRTTPRLARLGRVRVEPARPRAGETLTVRAEILPYRSDPFWTELSLRVPPGLPPGPLRVHLGDGGQAFGEELSRATGRWSHPGLRTVREAFALRRSAGELVAALYAPNRSTVVRGVELERLPASVRAVMERGEGKPSPEPVAATALDRTWTDTGWLLVGASARIDLELLPGDRR